MLITNLTFCKLRDTKGQVSPRTDAYPEPGLRLAHSAYSVSMCGGE